MKKDKIRQLVHSMEYEMQPPESLKNEVLRRVLEQRAGIREERAVELCLIERLVFANPLLAAVVLSPCISGALWLMAGAGGLQIFK